MPIYQSIDQYALIRSSARFIPILPSILIAIYVYNIKKRDIMNAIYKPILFSTFLLVFSLIIVKNFENYLVTIIWLFISGLLYMLFLFLFAKKEIAIAIEIIAPSKTKEQ
jgi:hypothetical protein